MDVPRQPPGANLLNGTVDAQQGHVSGATWAQQQPAIASVATAIVIIALIRLLLGGRRKRAFADLSGPRPLPGLGNLVELLRDGYPAAHLRWLKQFGHVYKFYMGCKEFVMVSDLEMLKELVLKKFKSFPNRPLVEYAQRDDTKGLIFGRDQYWASARSAVLPLFHGAQLRSYATEMNECADRLSQRLEAASKSGEVVPISLWFQAMTLDVFARAAFGIDFGLQDASSERRELTDAVQQYVRHTAEPGLSALASLLLGSWIQFPAQDILSRIPGTVENRSLKNLNIVRSESYKLLLAARELSRKAEERAAVVASDAAAEGADSGASGTDKDLLSLLLKARLKDTGSTLTDSEVTRLTTELIMAGYETTASTLTFTVMLLASHPEVEAKMVAEIRSKFTGQPLTADDMVDYPYVEMVVKEAQRLFPVGAALVRTANEDTTLGELSVPANSNFLVPVYAMHRNAENFKDPDTFRPERFDPSSEECRSMHPYAYIPFGAGPRMCPGYKFALQEACITLIHIYSRFMFQLAGRLAELSGPKITTEMPLAAGIVLQPKGVVEVHVRAIGA